MMIQGIENWNTSQILKSHPESGGGRGQGKRVRTYVHLWLTPVDVWQKPTQHCKAIILQLKIN